MVTGLMDKGEWVKGWESALGACVRPGAAVQEAAAPVFVVGLVAFVRCRLYQLLQELAKQRMIKFVSPSSCSNEQTLFSQARKVFCLEFRREMVNREFTVSKVGELSYELKFLAAEL